MEHSSCFVACVWGGGGELTFRKREQNDLQSISGKKAVSDLNKHIIILDNEGVRVNISWKRFTSDGFRAVLHPAGDVLCI